jgi:hypothetical protein
MIDDRRAAILAGRAVVVNLKTDRELIAWAKAEGSFTRVDRRSDWGNPYPMKTEADRNQACDDFAAYLAGSDLLGRVPELKGHALGCWCYPKRCHADHLARLANE